MKIKFLGNGGAINNGLPYNSFIIDGRFLIETPPDIMLSLARENIDYDLIDKIYISHIHGDHCFGFPFLALQLYFKSQLNKTRKQIRVYCPEKAKDILLELTEIAVSAVHPLLNWMNENFSFINISDISELSINDFKMKLYKMDHYEENYGFTLERKNENIISYISDNVVNMLNSGSKAIIVDLNGEPDDPFQIHLSENDLLKNISAGNSKTTFYGTHLKYQKDSQNRKIIYTKPGMEIIIDDESGTSAGE